MTSKAEILAEETRFRERERLLKMGRLRHRIEACAAMQCPVYAADLAVAYDVTVEDVDDLADELGLHSRAICTDFPGRRTAG